MCYVTLYGSVVYMASWHCIVRYHIHCRSRCEANACMARVYSAYTDCCYKTTAFVMDVWRMRQLNSSAVSLVMSDIVSMHYECWWIFCHVESYICWTNVPATSCYHENGYCVVAVCIVIGARFEWGLSYDGRSLCGNWYIVLWTVVTVHLTPLDR